MLSPTRLFDDESGSLLAITEDAVHQACVPPYAALSAWRAVAHAP